MPKTTYDPALPTRNTFGEVPTRNPAANVPLDPARERADEDAKTADPHHVADTGEEAERHDERGVHEEHG